MNREEEFRALATEAAPHQHRLAEIGARMVELSREITLDIVREAFPQAEVRTIRCVSEIKPSDLAKSANEAVRLLRENNVTPTTIIVDTARSLVLLGIEDRKALPRKGKSRQ